MNLVGPAGTGVGGGDGTASGVLNIIDNAASGINVGGTITLGGNYIASGNAYALTFAGIKGGKENTTDYSSAGYLSLYTTPSGASPTEKMRITSGGAVGIGVTPSGWGSGYTSALQIGPSGSMFAYSNAIQFGSNYYFNGTSYIAIQTGSAGKLSFSGNTFNIEIAASVTGGSALTFTNPLSITSGGNVLVGGTYNTARLTVIGEDNSSSTRAFAVRNLGLDNMFNIRNDGLINSGLAAYSPYNNSTTGRTMVIQSDGSLGYLVSTRESKANIDSIKSIDFINKLNPVQFNYRKKNDLTNTYSNEIYDKITYGFIADEVEKVNKELVFYNSDGTTLAGVEYNSMIAILTKAVQELSAKNEALIKRIETLENK